MSVLLHPGYFPNIITFAVIAQQKVIWEKHDNYQKQTFRNRCHICTDRGKQTLTIPIVHSKSGKEKQKYAVVQPDNSYLWQRQHWRTLQTAYRTSPFFEYYEDEITPLFDTDYNSLFEFNLATIEAICNCLQINMPNTFTESYEVHPAKYKDYRPLIEAKRKTGTQLASYTQVFSDRHDFIPNTSILDLLFNEGTSALSYLKEIEVAL